MHSVSNRLPSLIVVWFLLSLVGGAACALTAEEAVDLMEERRYQAMIEADLVALADMLADELIYHQPTGRVANKADVLREIREGHIRFHEARRFEVKIQVYGNVATVMGLAFLDLDLQGERKQVVVRYLNVWVLRDGRWQLASRQSALVPK